MCISLEEELQHIPASYPSNKKMLTITAFEINVKKISRKSALRLMNFIIIIEHYIVTLFTPAKFHLQDKFLELIAMSSLQKPC